MSESAEKRSWPYFMLGTMIGAVLGVLFAPRAGKETREELGDWLQEKREKTKEVIAELRHKVPAEKERISAAIRAGKEAYQSGPRREDLVGV